MRFRALCSLPVLFLAACNGSLPRESLEEFRRQWPDGSCPMAFEEFERLHRALQPPAGELWRTVAWKTDLLEARAAAVREGKPLFIWAMDGSPLGCG